ncbi:MAG TPA: hypothetical protein VH682_01275 [Gemmataceae bacterium]
MAQALGDERESTRWDEFASRHVGQPFLICVTLYSLNESILDAIQAEIPGFFAKDHEKFERDLASTASFGFFCQHALGFSESDASSVASLDERHARSDKAIEDMLKEDFRRAGVSDAEIQSSFAAGKERREVIDIRKNGYIGWLVTNRQFREEVRCLRAAWEDQIRNLGRFPRFPHWPLHDLGLETVVPNDFVEDFLGFYCRWNLQQMLTWEWPIPMEPDLVGGMLKNDDRLAEAGVKVFLPWYMLRGEKLNLQEIVRHSRATDSPLHLREWVQKTRRKQDELGDLRYERLAFLFRFLELALRQRYPEACRRRAQKLDLAFSRVLGREQESVRRLRLELQRCLR